MADTHRIPTIGLVGEYQPVGGAELCVKCGRKKSESGDLCLRCRREKTAAAAERREFAKRRVSRLARQPLVDAAIAAGWPVTEVMRMAAEDRLPTWEEIRDRRVAQLIKGFCEGMGE